MRTPLVVFVRSVFTSANITSEYANEKGSGELTNSGSVKIKWPHVAAIFQLDSLSYLERMPAPFSFKSKSASLKVMRFPL